VSCGGLYLKFGQIVGSLDIVIPDEYRTELRDLMTLCPEDTYEEVRRNVEKEIGMKLEDMFSEFDKKPVASASIAQVHRARLRTGEEVAVKVQHDGLIESTRFDIAVLSLFVDLGERMFEGFRYRWLVEEMSKNLPKELNFTL
jgi:aarF domain-containing kinase